jgi:glycosyltransferase involved in cell wall biosynthesis
MTHPVCVNARSFGRRITGVERYAREVTPRLGIPLKLVGTGAAQGLLGHIWEQTVLPYQVHRHQLLWSPANTGPLNVSNQVLSLHDLSVIEHPEWFGQHFTSWYGWFLPRLAHKVKVIVTGSIYTLIRIQEALRIGETKIRVAPYGVDPASFHPCPPAEQARVRRKYGLGEAYILFLGSLEPRKNLKTLLEAWRVIERKVDPLQLVIAGSPNNSFRKDPGEVPIQASNIRWTGYVDQADLPGMYSGARLFVWPSIYEGFGLPVLEAMACGTPVIAGDSTATPEVVGRAGMLVDARSAGEIANAMLTLIDDPGLRHELIRKGLERAQIFTWERTARLVREAIEFAGE